MNEAWRDYPEMEEIRRLIRIIGTRPGSRKLFAIIVKQLEVLASYKATRRRL